MWSVSGQQLIKRRKARMPANDFHTSRASPLAKVVLRDGEQEAKMALITTVFYTKGGCGKTLTTTTSGDIHTFLGCQGGA